MGMFDYIELHYEHDNIRKEDLNKDDISANLYQSKDLTCTCATYEIDEKGIFVQKTFPNLFGWKESEYIWERSVGNLGIDKSWAFCINRYIDSEGYPSYKYKEEAIYIFELVGFTVQVVEQYIIPYGYLEKDCRLLKVALKKHGL